MNKESEASHGDPPLGMRLSDGFAGFAQCMHEICENCHVDMTCQVCYTGLASAVLAKEIQMQFPFTPTTDLQHRWGGKIMLVHGIKHQACPPKDGRSLDGWWFDCDVRWDDTGKVSRSPVESFKLCAEEGGRNPDIQALDAAMMEYLKANARHCDDRTKHEGWYFNERRAKATA